MAQLAFYFLLALFPAVLFLVALVGYLPVDDALFELVVALDAVAPKEFVAILRGQLDQIAGDSHGSLLTLGIIGAIWSSSAAMVGMIDALNRAYDITEWRSWWKRRFVAIALTMALAVFVLVALVFVLIGPTVASRAAAWFGLAPAFAVVWQMIRWPIIVYRGGTERCHRGRLASESIRPDEGVMSSTMPRRRTADATRPS